MSKLPKHILDALRNNKTSLGEHPSFPPDEEEKFIVCLVSDIFDLMSQGIEYDIDSLKTKLSALIHKCKKIENNSKQGLEQICQKVIYKIFDIPENTVQINMSIVDKIDTKSNRLFPERTKGFTFDSIDDMNSLTNEIYKRRMLNVLVEGASIYYTNKLSPRIKIISKLNPILPILYKAILHINTFLLYVDTDETNKKKHNNDAGNVDVNVASYDIQPTIESEGVIFPVLLNETIKGILELSIAHGLPKDLDKTKYILSKADFKFAEVWDMRLGYALWTVIESVMKEIDINILEIGINYFFMELSKLECDEFNYFLQNVFARTKKGKEFLEDLCYKIQSKKEQDKFNDFMKAKNASVTQLYDDDEYYTPEELLNDEYYTSEELLSEEI